MKKEEYLETLTAQIRCRLAREPIRKEMEAHIEDQMEMYLAEGMTAKEAEEAAVLEMGNPVEAGEELDKIHRPKIPWLLVGCIVIISLIGFGFQYRFLASHEFGIQEYFHFDRQFAFLVLGWLVMILVCYIDMSRLIRYAGICLVVLYLCLLPGFSGFISIEQMFSFLSDRSSVNETTLTLLLIPLYAAILCGFKGKGYGGFLSAIAILTLIIPTEIRCIGFPITGVCFLLLNLAVSKGWFQIKERIGLCILWGSAIIGMISGLPLLGGYRRRIEEWLNIQHPNKILEKMWEGARFWGAGKYQPEEILEIQDYLLAYIVNKYGVGFGILILLFVGIVLAHLFIKALQQKNQNSMMLGVACSGVFLIEFLIYVLDNLGIKFYVCTYCPFLTYGGTGNLVTFCMLGILLNIFRYEKVMVLYRDRVKSKSKKEHKVLAISIVVVIFLFFIARSTWRNRTLPGNDITKYIDTMTDVTVMVQKTSETGSGTKYLAKHELSDSEFDTFIDHLSETTIKNIYDQAFVLRSEYRYYVTINRNDQKPKCELQFCNDDAVIFDFEYENYSQKPVYERYEIQSTKVIEYLESLLQ